MQKKIDFFKILKSTSTLKRCRTRRLTLTYEMTSYLIPISDLFPDVVSSVRSYIRRFKRRSYVLFDVKNDVVFDVKFFK